MYLFSIYSLLFSTRERGEGWVLGKLPLRLFALTPARKSRVKVMA